MVDANCQIIYTHVINTFSHRSNPIDGKCGEGDHGIGTSCTDYEDKKCNKSIELDKNSNAYLNEKRTDIEWSRARPDEPEEGKLFCQLSFIGVNCHTKYTHVISDTEASPTIHDGKCRDGEEGFGIFGTACNTHEEKVCDNYSGSHKDKYEDAPYPTYFCENAIGVTYSANRTGNNTLIALYDGNDEAVGSKDNPNIFLVGNRDKIFTGGDKDDLFILYRNESFSGKIDGGGGTNILKCTKQDII